MLLPALIPAAVSTLPEDIAAGTVPALIAAGTGVTASGLALAASILIAGLGVDTILGTISKTLLGPAGPETSRYNPINGQALNRSPVPGMYGNGYVDSLSSFTNSTSAFDLTTIGERIAANTLAVKTAIDDIKIVVGAASHDVHALLDPPKHTRDTQTNPIIKIPANDPGLVGEKKKSADTMGPVTLSALDAVQAFFTQKPVVTVPGLSDLLTHRDTSAADLHAAATSLDSTVASWRGSMGMLDSAAKELHDSRPPIPNVSVTVNTTVTGKDVAQTQTHSHWYTPGGGEVSM